MSSIKAVAEHAHVSIATVSRVLNGTKYVSPDVEKRVLEAIEVLSYQPNISARNLRRQSTLSIGVLLPRLNDFYFGNLAYILEQSLSAKGYKPLFCSTENDAAKEADLVGNLISNNVDGVILVPLVPARKSTESIERLSERDIPVVLVDRTMPDLKVSQIFSDNEQGAYDAAAYLLQLGHRHIGVIDSGAERTKYVGEPGYERLKGFQRAMHERGMKVDESLVIFGDLDNLEMGYQGALKLMLQSPRVTAIFALTDAIAIGVLHAAAQLGLNVPHDLSVVGFDDILLASHIIPRLTTVAQPIDKIGQKATDLILKQLQGAEVLPETVKLETQLVIRDSTAPPRLR